MRWPSILILALTMLVSACGHQAAPAKGEKIAVVNWDKLMEAHPSAADLKAKKDAYDLLVIRRKNVAQDGQLQLSGLAKLQQLKDNSRHNYQQADYQTRLAEQQALEQEKRQADYNAAVAEAKSVTAEEEAAVEKTYQLRIFNLRLKLDNVAMTPKQREAVLNELEQAAGERNEAVNRLFARRAQYVREKMTPLEEARQARLEAFAKTVQEELRNSQPSQEEAAAFKEAPAALADLVGSLDKQLDKRQQEIELLQTTMRHELESLVMKTARQKGYTIVFHKVRVNLKADDITEELIKEAQKLKKK